MRAELGAHGDVACNELAGYELQHLAHDRVEIDGLPIRLALLQEAAQALDDLRRALVVVDDVPEYFLDLLRDAGTASQQPERGLGDAADGGEGLIQLVREGPRELAEDCRAPRSTVSY